MTFREVRESVGDALFKQVGRVSSHVHRTRTLPVDVLENDDGYLVVFDAPGAEPEDVQVRYVHGAVKLRVDRFREFYESFDVRYPGRSMELDGEAQLPDDALVDPDAATARLTEIGTLEIDIPRADVDEPPAEADEPGVDDVAETDAEEISIDD